MVNTKMLLNLYVGNHISTIQVLNIFGLYFLIKMHCNLSKLFPDYNNDNACLRFVKNRGCKGEDVNYTLTV